MRQQVQVTRLIDECHAEVTLRRQSACSGDCGSCGGCAAAGQWITVQAVNTIGAQPGDRVLVETAGKTVITAALLVYLVPLVLFFAGWAVGAAIGRGGTSALLGALGFLAGMVPAVCFNRYLSRRPVTYTITAFV